MASPSASCTGQRSLVTFSRSVCQRQEEPSANSGIPILPTVRPTCTYTVPMRSVNWSAQVVVDAIDPSVLVSRAETKLYDFGAIEEEELHDITIPLDLQISACSR